LQEDVGGAEAREIVSMSRWYLQTMNDAFTRQQFLILGSTAPHISANEARRISGTLALVPSNWASILDIGCGDGRVSNPLMGQGRQIVGMDWSTTSLTHCKSDCFVGDIRDSWPIANSFDGVICAEVLEHLPQQQIDMVLKNIRLHSLHGFIISVPARETMEVHMIECKQCHGAYHIWGHLHRFESFEDVDELVGSFSVQRLFVPYEGPSPSLLIGRWKKHLQYQMVADNTVCPFCGERPEKEVTHSFSKRILPAALGKLELFTNFLRPQTGWFICRYEVRPL
jgi:SAM-dependent methyltransferase